MTSGWYTFCSLSVLRRQLYQSQVLPSVRTLYRILLETIYPLSPDPFGFPSSSETSIATKGLKWYVTLVDSRKF